MRMFASGADEATSLCFDWKVTQRQQMAIVIFSKNEETNISSAIESVDGAFPVVVVDSQSTDGTVEIARQFGAEVLQFEWNGQFPKKREWTIAKLRSKYKWIFFLDADERATPALLAELRQITGGSSECAAYMCRYRYHFAGRELRHGHTVQKKVLLATELNWFPPVADLDIPGMGELEGHFQPQTRGKVGHLKSMVSHEDNDFVGDWVRRHERYSDWEVGVRRDSALQLQVRNLKTGQGRLFDRMPFQPVAFFIFSYIIKLGFLDGRAGLDYAIALAWYRWLISLKMREIKIRIKEAN